MLLCRLCDSAFEYGFTRADGEYNIKKSKELEDVPHESVQSWMGNVEDALKLRNGMEYCPDPRFLKRKLKILEFEKLLDGP